MNSNEQQLKEKYTSLPADVKEAIFSTDVEKTITALGERHALHLDQIGELMEVTQLVMLGILSPKDFIRDLYERLGIKDKQKVRDIAHEVNEKVFQPIRESLQRVHNTNPKTGNIQPETFAPSQTPRSSSASDAIETKDEVLKEIEKKEPEVKQDEMKDIIAAAQVPKQSKPTHDVMRTEAEPVEDSIAKAKLLGPQSAPIKKIEYSAEEYAEEKLPGGIDHIVIQPKENKPHGGGYSGGTDPYREPVD